MRGWLAALSLVLLGAIFLRYLPLRGEDFIYYYCAGRSAAAGRSPYEAGPYQQCIAEVYGQPNPTASRQTGSVYPPPAVNLFRGLALFPYPLAYLLWNAVLLLASVLLLRLTMADSALWLLLVTWPGFISSWAYHKLSIPLVLIFLAGLRLVDKDRHRVGGALLGALCVQPQWLGAASLYLVAQKRWRALGALCVSGLLLCAVAPLGWFAQWLPSAAFHANNLIGFDNQSLFVSLYKLVGPLFLPDERAVELARYGTSLALGVLAWRCAARKDSPGPGLFLAIVLLAQPYSHISDGLWAFPFFLEVLARLESRFLWPRAAALAAGLLFNTAAFVLMGGFVPGLMHRPGDQIRQGYLACAVVGLYALALGIRRRTQAPSVRPSSG